MLQKFKSKQANDSKTMEEQVAAQLHKSLCNQNAKKMVEMAKIGVQKQAITGEIW